MERKEIKMSNTLSIVVAVSSTLSAILQAYALKKSYDKFMSDKQIDGGDDCCDNCGD